MFDLDGAKFERGVFELKLEKKAPWIIRPFVSLGEIRGRLLAVTIFIGAGFLSYYRQPFRYLVENGIVNSPFEAVPIQKFITHGLLGVGVVIYLFIFFFRKERMLLAFDKHENVMRYKHIPLGAKNPSREGLVAFQDIEKIEVFGQNSPQKDMGAAPGVIEIKTRNPKAAYASIKFRILTEEQKKYFPLNLSRITGKEPVGDWTDPDLDLQGTKTIVAKT